MFSAELELATSGLHLRCTQRLAMLPASLAPHVRQQTKQKKILKNKKFLRLSYIRKVISSFGNIMIDRCHSRDPAQVIHVYNPPWDQCLHYRVSWFLLFSCLFFFCLFEDRLWYIVDKNILMVSLSKGGRKVAEDYCKEIPTNFCRYIGLITCVFELLWTIDACPFFYHRIVFYYS